MMSNINKSIKKDTLKECSFEEEPENPEILVQSPTEPRYWSILVQKYQTVPCYIQY
jgi:hypothetical protein